MKEYKSIKMSRIFLTLISAIMLMILINGIAYANTDTKSTGDSSNSNFSIQNVITAVKNFDQAGKKTDGGIDAKAMGDKFAEQLKPIGDLIISVGMIVCVAVSIIFGMKFVAASRKRSRNRKIKNAIFWICNCIFCVCFSIFNMELYSKNYFRNGSESLRNSFKIFYLNLI